MILDGLLLFTGSTGGTPSAGSPATPGPLTDLPTTTGQFSSQVVDLGLNSGIPSSANGGGARDIGIGDNPALELLIQVAATFAGGTSLQVSLQGAPDNGAGAPGTYTTMWSSPVVALAGLLQGVQLANVTVPRTVPGQPVPRFLRLLYTIVGTMSGGGALQGGIVLDRFDQLIGPTGALSNYPAGINVAN